MTFLSKSEARKMIARYHNFDGAENFKGCDGIRAVFDRLGSIQYDPLNVVGRNADLVLQSRIMEYKTEYLYSLLYDTHCLIDGFDKEMCIYSALDFAHFGKVREAHIKTVQMTLDYRGQTGALDILDDVKAFVKEHGMTGTKDISIGEVRESRWGHKKLSSAALDYLYNKGDLCIVKKNGTQKYFDLTERVLSSDLCTVDDMKTDDFLEWYIARRISCVGMLWDKNGGAWQGHFVSDKDLRKNVLNRLVEKGIIQTFKVDEISDIFYACKDFSSYAEKAINPQNDYARFIAPLDNLMWDRAMLESLFDFSYRWEVYTPVSKRKYGYYVIPVLYNNRFVARFEPEPVSKTNAFIIKNWWWENDVKPDDAMRSAIQAQIKRFCLYLGVDNESQNVIDGI